MEGVLVLARVEESPDSGLALPAWALQMLGLHEGIWQADVRQDGRVILRRADMGTGATGGRTPTDPSAPASS